MSTYVFLKDVSFWATTPRPIDYIVLILFTEVLDIPISSYR